VGIFPKPYRKTYNAHTVRTVPNLHRKINNTHTVRTVPKPHRKTNNTHTYRFIYWTLELIRECDIIGFSMGLWNSTDSVPLFDFLLYFGTVLTV
jgi:hypothetical protein